MEVSSSHCSHVVPFSVSFVKERGQVLPNGNWSVDLGRLVDEHLLWWVYAFLRIKKKSKKLKRTKPIKIVMLETKWKKMMRTNTNRKPVKSISVLIGSFNFFLFYYVSNNTILLALVLLSSFQFFLLLLLVLRNVNSGV